MSLRAETRVSAKRLISAKLLMVSMIAMLALSGLGIEIARLCFHRQNRVATAAAEESDGSLSRFVPGERVIYAIDYINTSPSDFQKLFSSKESASTSKGTFSSGLAHSFETTVHADLVTTVLNKKGARATIVYGLRNPVVTVTANGQGAVAEAEKIQAELSRNVFAEADLQGRVLSVRFDTTVSSISQGFARAIIAGTQFVFPGTQASELRRWEVNEDDTTGQCVALYESQPGTGDCGAKGDFSDVKMFRKTKVRYLKTPAKTNSSELDIPTAINPSGYLTAGFDLTRGRVVCLKGKESLTVTMARKIVARAETRVELNYTGEERLSQPELSAMRIAGARQEGEAPVSLSAANSKDQSEASIQRTELGDATIESLLAELAQMEASTGKDETSLYLKFKALVYLHPETSSVLGEILTTVHPDSATARVLIGALGAVGHLEAQAALAAAILGRADDWPALSILIPTLSAVKSPAQSSENTLRYVASSSSDWNIASTAQLALGAMARTLADKSPERSAKIVNWATENLSASALGELKRQWLLVLGNTGSAAAVPAVAQFVNDASPELRGAAVWALRFIESSQAEQLLIRALSTDPDKGVRFEAAVALGFRGLSAATVEAQRIAFAKESAVNIRLAVLRNLRQAQEAFPEVRVLVKQAAAKDRSKEIRLAAREITRK